MNMSFKNYCKLLFFATLTVIVIVAPPLTVAGILCYLQFSKAIVMYGAFGAAFFSLFAGVWLIDRIGNSDNIWKE